jgi:hypothetical protein
MTTEKKSITSTELLKQLQSKDASQVIKALNKLEKAGNVKDLPDIIRIMAQSTEPKLVYEFSAFLANIRSKEAPAVIAKFLTDPDCANIRVDLTRSCWESQLDYSPHLMLFARMFIAGDYILALEAFTVIENTCLDRQVSHKVLNEVTTLIRNSLPDQPETKQRLTKELIQVLEQYHPGD